MSNLFKMAIIMSVLVASLVMRVPPAQAGGNVIYEITSNDIAVVNIEYVDGAERRGLSNVALPWQKEVAVAEVRAQPPQGAEVRADWNPNARPSKWVVVRIYSHGQVICQTTLDIGNATCYGVTPHNA